MLLHNQKWNIGRIRMLLTVGLAMFAIAGCRQDDGSNENASKAHEETSSVTNSNRIDIPAMVRQNLGITFVKVERRPVRSTLRIPGQFELRQEARREYRAMLGGRVHLAVKQYDKVKAGDLLYVLDSPPWRRVQSKLAEAFKACYCCVPELDAAKAAVNENQVQLKFLGQRLLRLIEAGTRNVSLEAEQSKLNTTIPRLDAEVRAKEMDLRSARMTYKVLLNEAQSITGMKSSVLEAMLPGQEDELLQMPFWTSIDRFEIRAESDGVVNEVNVTEGGWLEEGELIIETIDPKVLRFHADALQADITKFSSGQQARIVPPQGGSIKLQDTIEGQIEIGFQAHATQRTIPIFLVPDQLPKWAKSGVTAYLEVYTNQNESAVLAIPEATVVRDGLDMIFFRRDPSNPSLAIRMEADLGDSDGRWIEVRSGVQLGDEIVLGGVYPLMLSSSDLGGRMEGGHFHSDGTFHPSDED